MVLSIIFALLALCCGIGSLRFAQEPYQEAISGIEIGIALILLIYGSLHL